MSPLKAKTIISFLVLITFLIFPDEVLSQRRQRTSRLPEVSRGDTLNIVPATDSLSTDSIAVVDTVSGRRQQPFDAPIVYEANDSIVITFTEGVNAHLYGQGKIDYESIELVSDIISMNMDSSTVYARGREDSLGVVTGRPVFKDGETPYETNTIRYNLRSRRGLISNVITQQGEGYVVGNNAKKGANDELFMINGRYTTCDHHDHPHFYLQLTRAKVRPKKNVVTGPAYLVVEDVPLPIAVPFFFFPFSSSYSSGFLMPSYMDDSNRGFGLTQGGYYFAISDKMDLKVLGDIFTRGSWALGIESNYIKRYRYSGALLFNYQVTKLGDKAVPEEYSVAKDLKVVWNHRQDPKASPNSSFSANVNFSTSSYERQNVGNFYNPTAATQNTKTSSVSYSRTFPDQKLTIASTFNIAQTLRDSSIAVTLPDMNISLSRIFPFKRRRAVGEERWYEKISLSYTGRLTNSIRTKDDQIFNSNLIKDWNNGMQHNIPVSATFTLFNYFNITPSVNYTERWYTRKVMQDWNPTEGKVLPTDTIYGFHRVYNYNASIGISTKLYGMYTPLFKFAREKEVQIRHVFTPQISISAAPDFGSERYGYHKKVTYLNPATGQQDTTYYSPYSYTGAAFSPPGRGKQGTINFDISNNLEMKIKSDKDSTGYKKVSLIDELGFSLSYNTAAETRPWSDLGVRLRLRLSKNYTLNLNSSFATYAYQFDETGRVYVGDRTEWSYGRFGRFQGWGSSFNYTLNNDTWKKWFGGKTDEELGKDNQTENPLGSDEEIPANTSRPKEEAVANADGYQEFSMPWSLNLNYSFNIREDTRKPINPKSMRYPYTYTHNLNISGNIKLSNKWAISFNSGYDFEFKEITQTTFQISRDLHCWNLSASLSPFGRYRSYNVTLRASASILRDLKYEQRNQMQSNIQWY